MNWACVNAGQISRKTAIAASKRVVWRMAWLRLESPKRWLESPKRYRSGAGGLFPANTANTGGRRDVAVEKVARRSQSIKKATPAQDWQESLLYLRRSSVGKDGVISTTATAVSGFATAAGFTAAAGFATARRGTAAIPMEQAAEAAQDAAATGLAARFAAARFATARGFTATAGFATARSFGSATAARLSGAAGLFGTTTAGFAAAGLFAAARLAAAIVVALEQAEQAATAATAARIATTRRLTTTMVTAEERRSAVGVGQSGAQDQRHNSKTKVHLETPTNTETGRGKHFWVHRAKQTRRGPLAHVASVE